MNTILLQKLNPNVSIKGPVGKLENTTVLNIMLCKSMRLSSEIGKIHSECKFIHWNVAVSQVYSIPREAST